MNGSKEQSSTVNDMLPESRQPASSAMPERSPRVFDVADLVGDGREAVILHDGQVYRLRITANRKLILTK